MQAEGSDCDCVFMSECSFFDQHEGLENTVRTVREIFCQGIGKKDCARFAVCSELGQEHVPNDLLPFDHLSADMIISKKKKVPA